MRRFLTACAGLAAALALSLAARPAAAAEPVVVPFIFWGGDVATFHANGGLETRADSIYDKLGLKLKLTPGDDFDKQVKDYKAGKSPFLRGTLSMLGQVSDDLTASADATPVVFLQLTWSAGDHLVGRENFKSLNDLKGKKIALQEGGPHVGMLNDLLTTARLKWSDISVVWTKDVSGDKGPAALFRKDKSIDGCFAITPDMTDLTGGLDLTGDGKDKSVKGAHVVVSTAQMSRSIADVYAVRRDFYKKNQDLVKKFAAGYLKGCEELVAAKKKAGDKWQEGKDGAAYRADVKLAQDIWGKDPALKDNVAKAEDVDGLISDATFVGLPGNVAFFTKEGNLSGFKNKARMALALPGDPAKDPPKKDPRGFDGPDFAIDELRKVGDLHGKAVTAPRISAEFKPDATKTIYSFNVKFQPNQAEFNEKEYGADFQRALEAASLFGNSVVVVRGHADPSLLAQRFAQAATTAGLMKKGDGKYEYNLTAGGTLDLNDTGKILKIIGDNNLSYDLDGDKGTLKGAVKALDDLTAKRAKAVGAAVVKFADGRGLVLDKSQVREDGVGVREPVVGYAEDEESWAKNRRVEFRILKVPADKILADEFDL
jgi:ABC-type nitrate/sulfonate/bicarbonate transport system substrate-binding protein